jgi:hypothetical protein
LAHRCPTCGKIVESERDKLSANVFVWTFMTVIVWGIFFHVSQWTLAWWSERRDLVVFSCAIPVIAIYFWVLYLRGKNR